MVLRALLGRSDPTDAPPRKCRVVTADSFSVSENAPGPPEPPVPSDGRDKSAAERGVHEVEHGIKSGKMVANAKEDERGCAAPATPVLLAVDDRTVLGPKICEEGVNETRRMGGGGGPGGVGREGGQNLQKRPAHQNAAKSAGKHGRARLTRMGFGELAGITIKEYRSSTRCSNLVS